MAKFTRSKPKKLPDMSNWSDTKIATFWEKHDSAEYLDQVEDVDIEISLPEEFRVISLRLNNLDIERAKRLAKAKGVPYTVLLRMWIKEKLEEAQST